MPTITLPFTLYASVGRPMIDPTDSRPGSPGARPGPTHATSTGPAVSNATPEGDWRLVAGRLRRYAVALCGDPDEAEDLAQHTIATLLDKAPHRADHAGYARRTLTRLWIDRQRTLRRRLVRAVAAAVDSLTQARPVDHAMDVAERLEQARRAIDSLPPRQKAVLTLRLVEGLDYPAIADAIGCEVSAVRSSLHLARAAVRRFVGPEHPPDEPDR